LPSASRVNDTGLVNAIIVEVRSGGDAELHPATLPMPPDERRRARVLAPHAVRRDLHHYASPRWGHDPAGGPGG
jgi:hypothetical protein